MSNIIWFFLFSMQENQWFRSNFNVSGCTQFARGLRQAIIQQVNQLWLKWCVSSTSLCFSWLEESNLIWIWKNRLFLNRSRVILWSGYCKTVSYIYFLCFAYFLTFIVNVLHAGGSPISSPVLNKRKFCDVALQVSFGFKVGVWLLHFHVESRGIIVQKSRSAPLPDSCEHGPESHGDCYRWFFTSQKTRHRCMRSTDARECPFYRFLIRDCRRICCVLMMNACAKSGTMPVT
jgi:hypothetical protein